MAVLLGLAAQPGEVVTRGELLDSVWDGAIVNEEVLTRAVSELRRLFDDDSHAPRVIETIRHRGYRLVTPVVAADTATPAATPGAIPAAKGAAGKIDAAAETLDPGGPRRLRVGHFALVLAALAATAVLVVWSLRGQGEPRVIREVYRGPVLMAEVPFTSFPGYERQPALSPDGTKVAFAWEGPAGDNIDIYVKLQNSDIPLRLTSDPAADAYPTWSPDGSEIAYVSGGDRRSRLQIVPAIGGPVRTLYESDCWIGGVDWSPIGGLLAFSTRPGSAEPYGIMLLDLTMRWVHPLTTPAAVWSGDFEPRFSTDGILVAFVRSSYVETGDLHVVSLAGGEARAVTEGQLRPHGMDWIADGSGLVFASGSSGIYHLWQARLADGHLTWIPTRGDCVWSPTLSAGGSMVFERLDLTTDILRIEVLDDSPWQLRTTSFLTSTRWDSDAHFSADGQRVAFTSSRSGSPELWSCAADGSEPTRLTSLGGAFVARPRWSPDGETVAFNAAPAGYAGIYLMDSGGGAPWRVTASDRQELLCDWSRDGQWIYFAAARDSTWDIYRERPNGSDEQRMTVGGGIVAQESLDGQTLYFTKPSVLGLWEIPTAGGDQTRVLEGLLPRDRGNWEAHRAGIFYIQRTTKDAYLCLYDGVTDVNAILTPVTGIAGSSLAVSPDGRSILYSRHEQREGDLVLVKHLLVPSNNLP